MNATNDKNDLLVTYGDLQLDFSTLPRSSLVAMLRRGVSHFLGSEQASKVTGLFKVDAEGKMKSEKPDTDENRAIALEEFQAKAVDALKAGTVGVNVRGPSVDPIMVIIRRLARAEVVNVLKANGVKPPAKADATVKTPDGKEYTLAELIDRRLDASLPAGKDKDGNAHLPRLEKEAKKIADEQARKAKKAEESAKAEGLAGL